MKNKKKTIKEEFREFIKKELLAITPYDEKKILDFIKDTFQRFIEKTTKKAEKWDDLYNWDINRKVDELIFKKKLLRKQQKWLKENL